MTRVTSKISLPEIEDLSLKMDALQSEEDLVLPRHLSYGGTFGISLALSQIAAKWSRSDKAGFLQFAKTPGVESEFSGASVYPHALVSMFMSKKFKDKSGEQERLEILRDAAPVVEAMTAYRYQETLKGNGVFLACFSGTKNEFIRPLYEHPTCDGGLRSSSDFQLLTKEILKASDSKFAYQTPKEQVECLANLIFELVENTNDHAVADETGRVFDFEYPNVRGILAKKIDIPEQGSKAVLRGDERTALWTTRALLSNDSSTQSLLEISIFDYGIGIAKTRLKANGRAVTLSDIPFSEEESIVKKAFSFGETTKSKHGTGSGLDTALRCLAQLGAALRLRTGRICYFQDFSKGSASFDPVHFIKSKPTLSEVPGTLYTLQIPLKKLSENPSK